MNGLLFKALVMSVVLLFGALNALAQNTGSATVRGVVKDPKGAVLANASITLINEGTKDQRKSVTNGDGIYVFSSVPAGRYTVRVESVNFKTSETTGLNIAPSDIRGVDISLEIGAATEIIQVTGTETLQTETGAKENTITSKQIDNLSIISRSSLELLRILPGVVAPDLNDLQSVSFGGGSNNNAAYHVNGMRGENISVTLDGSRMMDIGSNNGTIITANPDIVSEVKIQTSNYAAENGSSPIQISAGIKSGSRDFHGEAYLYSRPAALGANDRSNNITNPVTPKPASKYFYPGANFGGPVIIPGTDFNKNRDKLFFFVSYEYYYQRVDEGSNLIVVPTLKQRMGDFSELLTGSGSNLNQGRTVNVPTGCTVNGLTGGNPAPNNNLAPCIDPLGKALINLYPAPNFVDPNNRFNYVYSVLRPNDRNQLAGRIDYNVSEKTKLYVRLAREYEAQGFPRGLWWDSSSYEVPGKLTSDNTGRSVAANLTNIFSPTMTNEVLMSASKLSLNYTYQDPSKVSLKDLGLASPGFFPTSNPFIPVSIVDAWGGGIGGNLLTAYGYPIYAYNDSFSITDNLSKIKGAHTLKFGAFIEQANKKQQSNHDTDIVLGQWGQANATTNNYGDLLVGRPLEFTQATDRPQDNFRYYNYEFYAQDSWKARSNLTLEFGMRMAYLPNNFERKGLGVLFNPNLYDKAQGIFLNGDLKKPNGFQLASTGAIPKGVLPNNPPQWAPRLGFAWDVGGKGDLVIRGGGGLFYNRVQGNYDYYSSGQMPNTYSATVDTPWASATGLTFNDLKNFNPFSAISNVNITSRNIYSNEIPRVANMSLTVEKKLPMGNVLTVAYVGTQGRHLPQQASANFVPEHTLDHGIVGNSDLSVPINRLALNSAVIKQFTPFPNYNTVGLLQFTGTSTYHSLQATLSRQVGKSLQYFATYTFSKALGTTAVNESDGSAWIDPIDPRGRSWGVLPFDRTHIFNISYNYYFPNAKGFLGEHAITRGLLNGWQMSGITTFQSGTPLRLRFSGDLANASLAWFGTNAFINQGLNTGGITPIYSTNPSLTGTNLGDKILDVSKIGIPSAVGQTGALSPPFYLRLPSRSNFDVSFFKSFKISESKSLQVRTGFFNIFNQAYPTRIDVANANNSDINLTLNTACNVHVDGSTIPNGAGGFVGGSICDPTKGYSYTSDTLANFGRITNKHGHRIVEIAIKFYF